MNMELKVGDIIRLLGDYNSFFVKGGDYKYVYSDTWASYGIITGGAFLSINRFLAGKVPFEIIRRSA